MLQSVYGLNPTRLNRVDSTLQRMQDDPEVLDRSRLRFDADEPPPPYSAATIIEPPCLIFLAQRSEHEINELIRRPLDNEELCRTGQYNQIVPAAVYLYSSPSALSVGNRGAVFCDTSCVAMQRRLLQPGYSSGEARYTGGKAFLSEETTGGGPRTGGQDATDRKHYKCNVLIVEGLDILPIQVHFINIIRVIISPSKIAHPLLGLVGHFVH
jgi:hypothetical protein